MSSPIVTDPRFDPEPTYADAPPRERSGCRTCMIGCLIVAAIMLVLAVIFGIWVYRNWRDWGADLASTALAEAVDATALPAAEKQEMKVQVDRVTEAFRNERLSLQELGPLVEQIAESPVMTTLIVSVAEKQYLDGSGLNDEEKAEGRKSLARFLRGMIDEKIDEQQLDAVMVHIADRGPGGNWELRRHVNDEDLGKFLAAAKEAADKAEIPAEPETVDPSEELKKMIDAALNEP
jgi:hypothetical protein